MIAPPEGDMAAYLATLRRLAALQLQIIYPGHGPVIELPAEKIAEYIAHRLQRERQVLAAVAQGASTPAQIRQLVYPDLDSPLFAAAEGSVRAHLAKLLSEGRVRADESGYRLVA